MDKKQQEMLKYSSLISSAIMDIFTDEESQYHIEIDDENATDVITSMVFAITLVFNKLSAQDLNYLEFTHMANSLVVQYLLKYGKVKGVSE